MALLSHEDGIQESYDIFEEGMEETAGKVVRLVKSKKSPNWVSEKTDKLREERNKAKLEYNNKHTKETKERCKAQNSELNKAYEQDEIKYLEGKLEELKRASETNQHEVVWRVVRELSVKRTPNAAAKVKKSDGTRIANTQELLSEWQQYFSKLLNNQSENASINPSPEEVDLPIDTGNITKSETAKAIVELRSKMVGRGGGGGALIFFPFCE